MELQLVSFEQAKALKELGFPQEAHPWHYMIFIQVFCIKTMMILNQYI